MQEHARARRSPSRPPGRPWRPAGRGCPPRRGRRPRWPGRGGRTSRRRPRWSGRDRRRPATSATGTMRTTVRREEGEHDIAPRCAVESRDQHDRAEHEPDQKRHERARLLGELDGLVDVARTRCRRPYRRRTRPRTRWCRRVLRRNRRRGQGPAPPRAGSRVRSSGASRPGAGAARADQPDANADARTTEELECRRGDGGRAAHRFGGRRSGQEQVDERRGDAVVQAALDIEHPAHSGGHHVRPP